MTDPILIQWLLLLDNNALNNLTVCKQMINNSK